MKEKNCNAFCRIIMSSNRMTFIACPQHNVVIYIQNHEKYGIGSFASRDVFVYECLCIHEVPCMCLLACFMCVMYMVKCVCVCVCVCVSVCVCVTVCVCVCVCECVCMSRVC